MATPAAIEPFFNALLVEAKYGYGSLPDMIAAVRKLQSPATVLAVVSYVGDLLAGRSSIARFDDDWRRWQHRFGVGWDGETRELLTAIHQALTA